tara:strand:- start:99 stop:281 length:183 start_codon:yes stop_codon:yes gene_type:complete
MFSALGASPLFGKALAQPSVHHPLIGMLFADYLSVEPTPEAHGSTGSLHTPELQLVELAQ